MNDYSFFPSFTWTGGGAGAAADWAGSNVSDPGTTVGRIQINLTAGGGGNPTYTLRWRYFTASDDPTIWVLHHPVTGAIVGIWVADDPIPNNLPGIQSPSFSSRLLKANDLASLLSPGDLSAGADLVAQKQLKMANAAYRALQLKANDLAPATWLLNNCVMDLKSSRIQKA
jgi:hypothetical protein